ncbi:hypothetical protein [Streptosporangium carneum]|uniref:Uncharacterized protein n=1 Tax=Streptosporangium carneum TaxID=47481 RepID=A0A9W6I4K1_9ACTN|nr:hypothetical protein [Streptosporangium carneum]GLK11099.1 hypothetical protein GCM10017600_45050 [Streptosporangium carneum]
MSDETTIVNGEVVPRSGITPDAVILPCHHGCTCGLHQQVVYGSLLDRRPPHVLDNGEMTHLTEASESATRRLNDYHGYLSRQRGAVEQRKANAENALRTFKVFLDGGMVFRARQALIEADRALASAAFHERGPAPRWLRLLTLATIVFVAIFDAYFFQRVFLDLLNIELHAPLLERSVGLVAAVVLAVSLVTAGRILADPIARLTNARRRPASADERPRVLRTLGRALALLAFPLLIFAVYALWAYIRGQLAADEAGGIVSVPPDWAVLLLIMVLAATVVVLEALIHRPHHENMRGAERAFERAAARATALSGDVEKAVSAYEHTWRDLRSCHDEVASVIRAELAKPWYDVILPARLRHGKAGPEPPKPLTQGDIATTPTAEWLAAAGLPYQIFEGVHQPQPGRGPLAETVRTLVELDPVTTREKFADLVRRLEAQLSWTRSSPEGSPESSEGLAGGSPEGFPESSEGFPEGFPESPEGLARSFPGSLPESPEASPEASLEASPEASPEEDR